jgi:hypothetical protein
MFVEKKSKRVSTRKRFKIEKKVREHNRKLKRLDKAKVKGKKGKKLIIVPGDCPFKEKILAEATLLKENIVKDKLARKEQGQLDRKAKKELAKSKATNADVGPHNSKPIKNKDGVALAGSSGVDKVKLTFEDLFKRAQERGYHFEKVEQQQQKNQGDASLKAFYRECQQVII